MPERHAARDPHGWIAAFVLGVPLLMSAACVDLTLVTVLERG